MSDLLEQLRALPAYKHDEFDGEESDGTPRRWRDRPHVSRFKVERIVVEHFTRLTNELGKACAERDALRVRAEAAEADARRYRWLREQHTYDGEGDMPNITRWYVQAGREPVPCDPGALDSAIDAAIDAQEQMR